MFATLEPVLDFYGQSEWYTQHKKFQLLAMSSTELQMADCIDWARETDSHFCDVVENFFSFIIKKKPVDDDCVPGRENELTIMMSRFRLNVYP